MALQFNFLTFAPATSSGGVTQVDSKVLVQGIGAKVKIAASQPSLIYVSDQPLPSSFTTFPNNAVVQLTELPTELYLAPGETIYAFNYTSNNTSNFVTVIHYVDEAPAQPLNLSGNISLSGQL